MATFDLVMPPAPVPYQWITRYRLEQRDYWFEFTWNDRDGFWYLRVGGSDRVTQLAAIKLTLGTNKLAAFKYRDVPPGSLDVVDVSDQWVEARESDFGDRVILRYTDYVSPDNTVAELFPPQILYPL